MNDPEMITLGTPSLLPGCNYLLTWVDYDHHGDACSKAQGVGGFSYDVRPSAIYREKFVLTTYWPTFASNESDMPSLGAAQRCAQAKHAGIINAIVNNPVRAQLADALRAALKQALPPGLGLVREGAVWLQCEAALRAFDEKALFPTPDMSDVNPGWMDEG